MQSVSDPLPTALLYQLLCPALRTNGNRFVAFNAGSLVLFASHVFSMKPNGSPNLPLHDCLRVRNRTWGDGGGDRGGRRERWRDELCSNRSYDLGWIWGKGMSIRSELYHPRMDNILWLDSMTPALLNIMKP